MKRIRRLIFIVIGVLALAALGLIGLQPGLARAFWVGFSDFTEVSKGVYVSPDTPSSRTDSLLLLISQAHQRNRLFWGEQQADFPILYCHTAEAFQRYAAVRNARVNPASFFYTPIFAYVLIGPTGLHSEVLAHEFCHPELFVRTGWYQHDFHLPVWFFEGLAMQLDGRKAYGNDQWLTLQQSKHPLPALTDLETGEAFFGGDPFVNYTLARHEVDRWLRIVGKQGLFELIDRLGEQDFMALYREIEARRSLP